MRLFTTISMEIGSMCNRTCWFCPNGTNTRPDVFMSDELLDKMLQELKALEYNGRIEFYIYNEPLRDSRLLDIIKTFRKHVPKSCLMIATNGDYIKTADHFQGLFDAGLNQLQVNVYSNIPRFKQLKGMLEQTTGIPDNVYSKVSPGKRVYSIEAKYDRKLTPDSPKMGRFELSNRSGNVPGLEKLMVPLKKLCVRPFRYMQVNWKGEVIICCNDYHAKVICGDINKDSLRHVWEGSEVLLKHRAKLIVNDRLKLPLCAPCSFKGGAYPHFIKKLWPELL